MVENLLKICPACGFSFKPVNPLTGKYRKTCPQCGFKLSEPSINPQKPRNFDKKIV